MSSPTNITIVTSPSGATLSQVGNNLLYQAVIGVIALVLFGIAIALQWNVDLTPRAANRPATVLKNVLLNAGRRTTDCNNRTTTKSKSNQDKEPDVEAVDVVDADRHCKRTVVSSTPTTTEDFTSTLRCEWFNKIYSLSWLRWTTNLTYQQALEGIPGTGSRSGGWDGNTLKLNLDNIILLKYHRLLAKVAGLASVLCLLVILPVYKTATCDPFQLGAEACINRWNLTDFENLTIVHVPPKQWQPTNYTATIQLENGTTVIVGPQNTNDVDEIFDQDITWRIAVVTLCTMIIYIYTCYLVWHEWIDNLALRRAFYLEADHYFNRKAELHRLAALQRRYEGRSRNGWEIEDDSGDFFIDKNRPPNICNPELRDTPPNIGLYSVLYQLPESLVTYEGDGLTQIEREQAATARFFDECIPKQSGFSSSVVAVTIIPSAQRVAKVWNEWYLCKSRLRRLRFIRKTLLDKTMSQKSSPYVSSISKLSLSIEEQQPQDIRGETAETNELDAVLFSEGTGSDDDATKPFFNKEAVRPQSEKRSLGSFDASQFQDNIVNEIPGNAKGQPFGVFNNPSTRQTSEIPHCPPSEMVNETLNCNTDENFENHDLGATDVVETIEFESTYRDSGVSTASSKSQPARFDYDSFDVDEFARQIGYAEESAMDDILDGMGIEQLNMFAYESALAAGGMCIYGKLDQLILMASVEDLQEMEQEAVDDLERAKAALIEAREAVADDDTDVEHGVIPLTSIGGESHLNDSHSTSAISTAGTGLRNRGSYNVEDTITNQWEQAMLVKKTLQAVRESEVLEEDSETKSKRKCCHRTARYFLPQSSGIKGSGKTFISSLDHPSYAIVTFTSRQAALAARQCLADGSSRNAWKQADDIPVPPLADAPARNIFFFRGCCRPITMRISYNEKKIRRFIVVVFLFFFFTLYTIPLSYVSEILVRGTDNVIADHRTDIYNAISGFMAGLANTLFFSFCPQLFNFVSFFEGGHSSLEKAERKALLYYWLFMLITAFSGTSLATMMFNLFESDQQVESSIRDALNAIGQAIPTQRAPVWLNWIVFRFGVTLCLGYLFQLNSFLTKVLRMQWLNRVMKGGGSGSPTPYRIYVDSGVVFMCITSLAPICPLIAPAAFIYYIIFQPILRWLLVFVYKPKYDSGGGKWFQLHTIIMSAMIVGQVLLGVVFALRSYIGGVVIGLCAIPTFAFHLIVSERFARAYRDCALLQTSQLDGWDNCSSELLREEYRRWLVDCHISSYVPTCLLGGKDVGLTAEPAFVVPRSTDTDTAGPGSQSHWLADQKRRRMMERQRQQRGVMCNPKYQ